jgi:hypothetical protein
VGCDEAGVVFGGGGDHLTDTIDLALAGAMAGVGA